MRLLVLASFFLTQFLVSDHFRSERSRLTLASDRGSGNFRSVMEPSRFVVESHSTPLVRCELGPLVGYLIASNALVAWAPPDLDPGVRLLRS